MDFILRLVESGKVPDFVLRNLIRLLLRKRLANLRSGQTVEAFVEEIRKAPLAVAVEDANEQHYEVAADLYERCLGKRMKYSSCYWPTGVLSLDESEEQMLELTCKHAGLVDGQDILELGCGWGSLTLWMAEKYPNSAIIAISNSNSQREYIELQLQQRGLKNVQILTCDMNDFQVSAEFDRIVSVEMFEHMRNYEELLRRISTWLKPDGRLFVHIFTHHKYAYLFETEGAANWMGRYFFTGGMMPSHDLLSRFSQHLQVERDWVVNGKHYQRTAEAWLTNLEKFKGQLMPVLARIYGEGSQNLWFVRWKLFFMACAELFGYREGEEWQVSHYLLRKV
jgi:cyclopropane-fatty-acyl-phospholipid synthase